MSEIKRSPMLIRIMLACYYSPEPEQEVGIQSWCSEVGKTVRAWLFENNLIDQDSRATERGKAWVDFLCETPLPEAQWILPSQAVNDKLRRSTDRMFRTAMSAFPDYRE